MSKKSKPRELKNVKTRLTEILDIDELKAIGGDEYNISAMSTDTEVPLCIECNGPVENRGRFERTLIDIITVDQVKKFARLHYCFYKYRCLDADCGAIFQKKAGFVKDNAKVTKRYEDEVMRHVMYESIDMTRGDMEAYIVEGHKRDLISKPAMSKLIKRWVADKDNERKFVDPEVVMLFTYNSFCNSYVIICDLTHGPRIIEVLPEISASLIKQFFAKIHKDTVQRVIVDCNPVVNASVHELFDQSRIMVDYNALRQVLHDEFREYLYQRHKKYQVYIRENLLRSPAELEEEDSPELNSILGKDEELAGLYNLYAQLSGLLLRQEDIIEIEAWAENLSGKSSEVYVITEGCIKAYRNELTNYYKSTYNKRDLYVKLYELNRKIESYFPVATAEVFRARLLYSDFSDTGASGWNGMTMEELEKIIDKMIADGGLKNHERK